MTTPVISEHPLYRLLREGKIDEFNQRVAAGEQVDLTSCDFRHLNLQGLIAKGLDFSNSYFRQADLRGIDFSQCISMNGASIHAAKISGAYFPEQVSAQEILLSLEHGTRMRSAG
ncbi:pentapeptide repeat-containing protein [Methylophaga thiooxydans]|uniref:Pentapeptide repeat protein n=1 Tax=Methylophaga thiooxydans DMS010 TaxID=637616 RepID=C0N5C0_9GAMM|nr:pentapeptide repeat-containing protein [Methylophaga thiooxydans]EEF79804.1 Pentapeptide repeat protein [Methylophaga thiooxydans DMS010]